MFLKKRWKIVKWVLVVVALYFFLTILYFGYSQVDEKKGVYTFYWSGLRALFNGEEFGLIKNKSLNTGFDGPDGPYLINNVAYSVDAKGSLIKSAVVNTEINVSTGKAYLQDFNVKLKAPDTVENAIYAAPEKLLVISDIEGNFTGFYSFLLSNGVIDTKGNWIYGKGHLVLNGDFVDRGKEVTQVLWLIYKLEQQAEAKGGKVHYILGNHEIMMLQGNVSYANFKYIQAAKSISGNTYWDEAARKLYSDDTELGKWLRTKNVVERIGNTVFVHAGLSVRHMDAGLDIQTLNQIARENYGKLYTKNFKSKKEELTLSSIYSPYWDRSLAMDFKNKALYFFNNISVKPTSQQDLNRILKYYGASRIVIGHSIVDDIKADYAGKVIKIDLKHGTQLRSGDTKGIFLENGRLYKVDDAANKTSLD
ncbi:MAG: metallophosphoesterase [Pedobacter sp.]|nr:MAG: metallophosphoesterase [Pedobacter sp.]